MRRFISMLFGIALLVGVAARAEAKVVHYMSQHPLPRKIGHGFCYIDVPHVHDFGPSDPRMYRDVNGDGELYFVGDPAPFGYDGPRYSFYGPHPVVEADLQFGHPVYCYLNGPHFHWYQPPAQAKFDFRGGAYWYTGDYDPAYYQDRPRYASVNEAYQPLSYPRPVVDVTVAPPSFHGEIVAGPGFPAPMGRAVIGAPGVSAGIFIQAPPPPQVHIGIGIGGPPIGGPPVVIEDRREIYEVDERHDNGRHRGWERHEEHGWRGGPEHEHGWRGGPEHEHDRGWHGGPEHGAAPQQQGGWRGAPQPQPHQQAQPSGWRAPPQPHQQGPQPGPQKPPPQGGWRGR